MTQDKTLKMLHTSKPREIIHLFMNSGAKSYADFSFPYANDNGRLPCQARDQF